MGWGMKITSFLFILIYIALIGCVGGDDVRDMSVKLGDGGGGGAGGSLSISSIIPRPAGEGQGNPYVTIIGSGFSSNATVKAVPTEGQEAPEINVEVKSDTEIIVTFQELLTGAYDLVVTNASGQEATATLIGDSFFNLNAGGTGLIFNGTSIRIDGDDSGSILVLDSENGEKEIRFQSNGERGFSLRGSPNNKKFDIFRHVGGEKASTPGFHINRETGNVGIGTSEPNQLIHVYSNSELNTKQDNTNIMVESSFGNAAVHSIGNKAAFILTDNDYDVVDKDNHRIVLQNDQGKTKFGTREYDADDKRYVVKDDNILVMDHATGNVGIGTGDPITALHLRGNFMIGGKDLTTGAGLIFYGPADAKIYNFYYSPTDDMFSFNHGLKSILEFTDSDNVKVYNDLYVDKNIIAEGGITYGGVLKGPGEDYAEYFQLSQPCEAMQVVAIDEHQKIRPARSSDAFILGIISSNPAIIGGSDVKKRDPNAQPVAFVGRVPAKILGVVAFGDWLSVSDQPGVLKKAEAGEMHVARAMASGSGVVEVLVGVDSQDYQKTLVEYKNDLTAKEKRIAELEAKDAKLQAQIKNLDRKVDIMMAIMQGKKNQDLARK